MSGGQLRAATVLAVAVLVIGVARRSASDHRIRNAVNGFRGARAARSRRRRALRTRGAGIAGPRRSGPVTHQIARAA
ncbi:hypothetical protein [Nocardia amamiensis]|uniref:hypothetical protein n=1 Tax=Nocardia amamiensis TaxID=404578 RepID=UPI00082E3732|nr:hypothetical protein [Nocardia amamiensis]